MTIDSGRRTALLIVTILCAACGAADAPEPIAKPQYGTWGFDRTGVDPATAPGDDFFRYANGSWLTRTDIPPDKTVYSLRIVMSDAIDQRLHDLMEQLSAGAEHEPRTTEGKIGAFYKSFMDEPRVEMLGAMPLAPLLDEVRANAALELLGEAEWENIES
jgi:putative endopeptidase